MAECLPRYWRIVGRKYFFPLGRGKKGAVTAAKFCLGNLHCYGTHASEQSDGANKDSVMLKKETPKPISNVLEKQRRPTNFPHSGSTKFCPKLHDF